MAFETLKHYLAVFTIDGVEHVVRGHTHTQATLDRHIKQVIDHRNATIPEEKTVFVSAKIMSPEEGDKIQEQVRNKNTNGTTAEELHPDAKNMLLHKPVSEPTAEVSLNDDI